MLREILNTSLANNTPINILFSSKRKSSEPVKQLKILTIADKLQLQSVFNDKTEFEFIDEKKLIATVETAINTYKQCLLRVDHKEFHFLINKKGIDKCVKEISDVKSENKSHNKTKNYLIPDNEPCDFLIEIGIMDSAGKVKPTGYKKFRQINRFLEMIHDLFKDSNKDKYHIVDFGCGKSYLTFAIYYYFVKIRSIPVKITGVDIKETVIKNCNTIAEKLNYESLKFVHGFIHDFKTDQNIDFVVTLHACDTATDDAILFSLKHQADKMMFVPCCQHELNKQIENNESNGMLKHGIFKDRMCSLVTDSMRSQLIEICGYKVQAMEFIDLEHTAKNILLRCVKTSRTDQQSKLLFQKYNLFKTQWGIEPYLEKELIKRGNLVGS